MKYFLITSAMVAISIGFFYLGSVYSSDASQEVENTNMDTTSDLSSVSTYIHIQECDAPGDLNACFGSGRRLITKTENTSIWSLVTKDGEAIYGVLEDESQKMFTVFIK